MKTLIKNPGKREEENKYRSHFISTEGKTKISRGIITAPLAMESSSAEYKFFRGDHMTLTYHAHNITFGNGCFAMSHGRLKKTKNKKQNMNKIGKILITMCINPFNLRRHKNNLF